MRSNPPSLRFGGARGEGRGEGAAALPKDARLELLKPGAFVEDILEAELASAGLPPADRGLCQELVYGTVRWQATLDWLITRKTRGRATKPRLRDLLRLGLYQIFWLDRIPPHAAVHETVELAKQTGLSSQSGFVNAVLRSFLREADATRGLLAELKTTRPHLGYSHPEWLTARWERRWGREKAARLMEWNNTAPKVFARVNTLKTQAEDLLARWREEKVDYEVVQRDWLEENLVFQLKSHPPLDRLSSFKQGWFYVQDPGTLLAPRLLGAQPGETVLDLCAAPGGKLTYIAQLMRNEGTIVAHDTAQERLKLIQENCERLGVTNVEYALSPTDSGSGFIQSSKFKVQGSRFPVLPSHLFDRILIDAPCSNTGVMRRRIELRWRIRPEEIQRLRTLQLELLRQAAPLLKPGGTLVYSTCSLEPEENQEVVEEFLREASESVLEQQRELLPFADEVDGSFVALMKRR